MWAVYGLILIKEARERPNLRCGRRQTLAVPSTGKSVGLLLLKLKQLAKAVDLLFPQLDRSKEVSICRTLIRRNALPPLKGLSSASRSRTSGGVERATSRAGVQLLL